VLKELRKTGIAVNLRRSYYPDMLRSGLSFFVSLLLLLIVFSASASQTERVDLKDVAARNGFSDFSVTAKSATMRSRYSLLSFGANSRKCFYNDVLIWLNAPTTGRGKRWTISRSDELKIVNALLREQTVLTGRKARTVILDPGHGGDDSGGIGRRRVYEKKVVLDVARRVKKKLQSSSVEVRLTRDWDISLGLLERPRLAKRWGGDVFVSIHANCAANRSASGIETYIMPASGFPSTSSTLPDTKAYPGNRNDAANVILGYYIQRGLLAHTGAVDRGVKRARFAVLRGARCPAVLVECGFVSNRAEEAKMIKPEYRDAIAEGIARGILTYISRTHAANR